MCEPRSISGAASKVFDGLVGKTVPAASLSQCDYLIDPVRFASEGIWAFCRFDGNEVPALRLGFQRGGFNGGILERDPNPSYLQLHLELMTREGAILWLPSGMYPADDVVCDPHSMRIRHDHNGRNIFAMQGWPTIDCHFGSDDRDLQADLQLALTAVTTLPDCTLPHCLFAMWESMGEVRGSIRYRDRSVAVKGKVFLDHTRVIPGRHLSMPRHMYVYTTLYFEDGSGLFGYHSVDRQERLINGYCFSVYLDAAGKGQFLEESALTHLALDGDGIAKSWEIACQTRDFALIVKVTVQNSGILRCWGSPDAPQTRKEFSIIPLLLNGSAQISGDSSPRMLKAYGLAEYFNADLWPADKAATSVNRTPGPP